MLHSFLHDLRFGARVLRRAPGFTVVAVVVLALGIGATTAIFSVVNPVLLRPLPFPEPERLVLLYENAPHLEVMSISVPNLRDWQRMNRSFERIGAVKSATITWTGVEQPERLYGIQASADMFAAVGARPVLGRLYTAEEDRPGGERVAIISHELWARRFGLDSSVVGQALTLNGASHTVIGVMPPGFTVLYNNVDIWVPLGPVLDALPQERGNHAGIFAIARLRDGVTIESARADMNGVVRQITSGITALADNGVTLVSLRDDAVSDVETALFFMFGAVGFVLLIACANVANLLLARAAAREHEIAIRLAMGAGRFRIVRQLLTESLVLAIAGGMLGLLLAIWGVDILLASLPAGAELPRQEEIGVDLWALGFTLVLSFLSALMFGLAPALQMMRRNPADALKSGGRWSSGSSRWLRGSLVVSEIAVALLLLAGAALMIKSFARLRDIDSGYDPKGVMMFWVDLPGFRYPGVAQWIGFHDQLLQRVRSLPGVESAGIGTALPLTGGWSETSVHAKGSPIPPDQSPVCLYQPVSAGFHRTLGIRLLKGRHFTEADREGSAPVAIIDRTLAEKFWPGEDPIGKLIAFEVIETEEKLPDGVKKGLWREVVGVVEHVRYYELEAESRVEVYVPYPQLPTWMREQRPPVGLVVRTTASDHAALASALRREVGAIDGNIPLFNIRTMEDVLSGYLARRRLTTWLIGIFSGVALLLALVGIYGVIAYSVRMRTREIGIRMALGAGRGDVIRLVLKEGLLLAAIGVALGLAVAFVAMPLIESFLYGVSSTDPAILIAISLLLLATTLAASFIPARRASGIDAVRALREG